MCETVEAWLRLSWSPSTVPVFGQIEYTRTGSAGVSVVDFRTAAGEGYDACMTINSDVRTWSGSRIIAAETVDVFSLDPWFSTPPCCTKPQPELATRSPTAIGGPASPTPPAHEERLSLSIRIALDARPLAGPPCGFTNYIASILDCLRQGDFDVTLVSNKPLLDKYDDDIQGLESRVFGRIGDVRWEQTDLPRHLDREDYHLYLSAANRGIPLRKRSRTRYLLVLYDVIPYLFYRNYYLDQWRIFAISTEMQSTLVANLIAAMIADSILTISRQSADDIRKVFRRRAVTSILIPLRDVERREQVEPKRQFVYVGGTDFRKRLDTLLRGFAMFVGEHPDHKLVLVGWNFAGIETLIGELGLDDHVELTGWVDEATKYRILGESLAMVYPSLYEGYGLAIAEGFQARIPVIAGTGGAQGEVGGAGIRQIDPRSPADVAEAMSDMLDRETRAEWIERGDEQLARLCDPSIEKDTLEYFLEQGRLAQAQRS